MADNSDRIYALIKRFRWQSNSQLLLSALLFFLVFSASTNLSTLYEEIRTASTKVQELGESAVHHIDDRLGYFAATPTARVTVQDVLDLATDDPQPIVVISHCLESKRKPVLSELEIKETLDELRILDGKNFNSTISILLKTQLWQCLIDASENSIKYEQLRNLVRFADEISSLHLEKPLFSFYEKRNSFKFDQAWDGVQSSYSPSFIQAINAIPENNWEITAKYRNIRRDLVNVYQYGFSDGKTSIVPSYKEQVIMMRATSMMDVWLDGRFREAPTLEVHQNDSRLHSELLPQFEQFVVDLKLPKDISIPRAVKMSERSVNIGILQLSLPRSTALTILPVLILLFAVGLLGTSQTISRAIESHEGKALWSDWYSLLPGKGALNVFLVSAVLPIIAVAYTAIAIVPELNKSLTIVALCVLSALLFLQLHSIKYCMSARKICLRISNQAIGKSRDNS